jgi:hypothetical protein
MRSNVKEDFGYQPIGGFNSPILIPKLMAGLLGASYTGQEQFGKTLFYGNSSF